VRGTEHVRYVIYREDRGICLAFDSWKEGKVIVTPRGISIRYS
jgi:hypothetical protein